MPSGKFYAVAGVVACLACAGCRPGELSLKPKPPPPPPPELADTVGEYASLVGGGGLLLDGHGVVAGLGANGSSEVPPRLKKYLVQYMLKQRIGSATAGTSGITPSEILADRDTAVARVIAAIPPGAPAGWTFDVQVMALSQSGTRSLDGGSLLRAEMHLAKGEGMPHDVGSRAWATAEGSIFVNPFLDPNNSTEVVRLREGRLIGGGRVLYPRPLRLVLREPDYVRCNVIQRRINQRFGRPRNIANARNPSTIELSIPPAYVNNYERFLQLVMHLPLQAGSGKWEARARDVAEAMQKAGANHDGLSLVWEAMGREVLGICRTLYGSRNRAASFYSARAGFRLRDDLAGEVMTRFATTAGSPFQVAAIEELGRQRWYFRSMPTLRGLIDADSELVRIAAYEALLELGDEKLITRIDVGGEFSLDLVTSRKSYVIYATQSREKRITLFGRHMNVCCPVFFNMPGDLVTLANKKDEKTGRDQLMVFRKIPRASRISAPFYLDFNVSSLVRTLGEVPQHDDDGRIKGLGLTYGQVVAVLYRMCEVDKDIPARFVLQPPPGARRIYRGAATVGRPDMPGE